MSAPRGAAPVTPTEPTEKKGLSKYVSRVKSVMRKKDGSKRFSISSKSPIVIAPSAGPSAPTTTTSAPATGETPAAPPVEEPTSTDGSKPTKILLSQIDAERAKKLSERFKLPIESKDWIAARKDKEAFRIEKPVRMRIHRTCHQCNTSFGGTKTCAQCQHERCSQCPRYPAKKDKKGKAKATEKTKSAGGIEIDTYYGLREQIILTMPSKNGGQPLVRKKPKQRVRRTCHTCSTLFAAGSKICASCNHARCVDCPREPAKKKYYPDGYPGDQYSATSTAPIKYDCHHCLKTFPPVPHPNSPEGQALGSTIEPLACTRCGHNRCVECPRAPPRKVQPAPDPDLMRSVEAKLTSLNLSRGET